MDVKCMNVWIVSYYEDGDKEATVTAFSNEEAAKLCYETFTKSRSHVSIDNVPLYSIFTVT